MTANSYEKILEMETTPEALEATVCYLARLIKPFLQTLEPVLICFPDEGPDSLGGIFKEAVLRCEAMPVFWGPDYRWKELLRIAFDTHANTLIGYPSVVLGLMKLAKVTGTPLYIYDVIACGDPFPRWMVNGLKLGFDCNAWAGLDANADWSVEEVALGDHYVATYSVKTSGNQIHVTVKNTREAQPIDITVKKVWRGGEGSSVRVNLYGNGKLIETVKITAASGWKHTWKNLPDNVEYKVDEVKMEGYFKKVTHDASGKNWVITNTVSVIPATGDTILVAVGVMAISAAALVILLAVSKKRKKNK